MVLLVEEVVVAVVVVAVVIVVVVVVEEAANTPVSPSSLPTSLLTVMEGGLLAAWAEPSEGEEASTISLLSTIPLARLPSSSTAAVEPSVAAPPVCHVSSTGDSCNSVPLAGAVVVEVATT